MEIAFTEMVPVTDVSSVGVARRTALTAAHRLGFDETRSGEFALLATEASRNVLLHGGGGEVIVGGIREPEAEPLARILAIDKGAGIPDIARAMCDGFSTAGTMGAGLGAMKRIATTFEIFTGKTGTIVLVELGSSAKKDALQFAGMAVPYPGEQICGDGWYCLNVPGRTVLLLVDGLGHGFGAAEAAQEAVAIFRQRVQSRPAQILGYIHDALRKTRGAVAAVAEIRPDDKVIVYAGVGNISGVVLDAGGGRRSLVSYSGTLGATVSKIQEFTSEWSSNSTLVLHSDGLQSKWDLSPYAGLISRHPALIGAALLRDFRRLRDDASVIVVKAA
jgi:anti-sigma regulatory factor (Ser/Thr protein kinase)